MNGMHLGIDFNGIADTWTVVEMSHKPVYRSGKGVTPPVVVIPVSPAEKPLAGKAALQSMTGKGWQWPDEAKGPDENGFCRRIPVLDLLEMTFNGRKEIQYCKDSTRSISELLGAHLSSLNTQKAVSSVVTIPDHADETFQQRILDSRYDSGLEELRLIWRPVATLLGWGQSLSLDRLLEIGNSEALVIYLGPLGFEVSILTLEVEDSTQGKLLTPIRSRPGSGPTSKDFSIYDMAREISRSYSALAGDSDLIWQML